MKKVQAVVKLQIPAGKANPSPPVGPALGQHGVNIMEFCKGFNAQTGREDGLILPVVVTIYQDRSFTFIAQTKLVDLNTDSIDSAMRIIEGTARSMGIDVV